MGRPDRPLPHPFAQPFTFRPLIPLRTPLLVLLVAGLLAPAPARSQDGDPFTAEDVLRMTSASVEALSPDGRWAVISYTSQADRLGIDSYRYGDPTYAAPVLSEVVLVETGTGEARPIFDEKRQLRRAAWSPDGGRLALVVREGGEREAREDAPFELLVWEAEGERLRRVALPSGRILADDQPLRWLPGGSRLLFAMRTTEWRERARARFEHEVHGPIVVRSSGNDFLSWEEIRRMSLDQSLGVHDADAGTVEEVVPEESLGSWSSTEDGEWLRLHRDVTPGTSYERIFGRDDRIVVRPVNGGDERVLFPTDEGLTIRWSGDERAWAYTEGDTLLFGRLELDEPRRLWEPEPDPDASGEEERGEAEAGEDSADGSDDDESFTPVRLSHDGSLLIASNSEGLWLFDTSTGERELFLEENRDDDQAPRWSVAAWEREGDRVYLSYASRTEWDWGVYRYDRRTGELTELVRDGRRYTNVRLSDDGGTVLVDAAEPGRPPEVYAADPDLRSLRRLTDSNPWLAERSLGEVELMEYLDVDGERLHGVVHYPPDFEAARPHPTVFILYETFFDPNFNSTAALLNAHGYVVVQPSVNLVRGRPGEAWLKGVTAAANQLIDRGIADPARLGVQGVSYGGYAVNLLVAQTPRFAAAINISGKTNMVSFYTDSPRLATRNIHAPERSQDRIGATLWEQPHTYLAHSAVMVADRIHTPLLLLTGQQDHNVTERTTSEMYYALRRLDREVEWVSYIDGGHGMPRSTREEAEDYLGRIVEWYERQMGEGAGEVADTESEGVRQGSGG